MSIIEIASTELICFHARDNKDRNNIMQRLMVISQIPNFRIGLIVKIIKMINDEIGGLITHIKAYQDDQDQIGSVKKRVSLYKGKTKVWDKSSADTHNVLTPKQCLERFIGYVKRV